MSLLHRLLYRSNDEKFVTSLKKLSTEQLEKVIEDADRKSARYHKTNKVMIITVVTILVCGMSLCSYRVVTDTRRDYARDQKLNTKGIRTSGQLDNEYTERRSTRSGTSYYVSYTFTVNGIAHKGSSKLFDQPSSPIVEIIYDPDDPQNSRVVGAEETFDSRDWLPTLAYIAFFAALSWGIFLLRLLISKFRN